MRDLRTERGEAGAGGGADALLLATARGDRAAFRALYDRAAAKLFGLTLRICRDRGLAEDALQDAFADIWHRAGTFDPGRGRAEAWMAVIARSRALDALRRQGRAPRPADDDGAVERIADAVPTGEAAAEFMALVACLGRLEPQRREAILSAYYMGLTREELAERFAVPVNTMKTWLRRGLAALRECLDE